MTLQEQITKMQEQMLPLIPGEVLQLLMKKTEELVNSGIAERALKTGEKIPEIILPNAENKLVSVSEYLNSGPVVISFYRGGWCPYCNLELKALQDNLQEIKALGANLIAISPETPDHSLSTSQKHNLQFEVLSDVGNKVSKKFNLVFNLAEELRPIYKQFNFDIPSYNGNDSWELPIPATYIVNSDGIIENCYVDANYTTRMEPADIIESLKKIKIKSV